MPIGANELKHTPFFSFFQVRRRMGPIEWKRRTVGRTDMVQESHRSIIKGSESCRGGVVW